MDNMKMFCRIIGKGKPLILLHGWGWHGGIWQPIESKLAESFELFIFDLPGFGKSPIWQEAYNIHELTDEIFKITPDKAAWLGWSLGGMIAWWVAINYPQKVTKLTTIACSPKFTATSDWPGVADSTLEFFKQNLLRDPSTTLSNFLELQLRGSIEQNEIIQTLTPILFPKHISYSQDAFLQSLNLLKNLDLRHNYHHLQCPSLHIYGKNDVLIPRSIAKHIQPNLPQGHCKVINGSGHIPFLTHKTEFYALLNIS